MFLRLYPTEKLIYIPFESQRVEAFLNKSKSTSFEKTDMMGSSSKPLHGSGYIILNGIRVVNIIGFLAVIVASVVMLVKINTSTNMFFFDAVSHVITLITSMFLITSELSLFRSYFARNWPLLSPTHGFVTLALAMIVLGINMLGNLNKQGLKQKDLGMPFWRIVIASGIIIFIMGWINLLANYIFRDRNNGITARQVRAKGASVHKTPIPSERGSATPPAPILAQSYIPNPITPSPTKTPNPFRFMTDRRTSTFNGAGDLPSYHTANLSASPPQDRPVSPTSKYSRMTSCSKKVGGFFMSRRDSRQSLAPPLPVNPQREMEISAPMGVNPQFAHLVPSPRRPDSALHPSRTGESQAFRWNAPPPTTTTTTTQRL